MSLNNALFYCIRNGIKGLFHKTQRSHRVNHILQVTARTSMCMSPTDCYIFFSIQISKPSQRLTVKQKPCYFFVLNKKKNHPFVSVPFSFRGFDVPFNLVIGIIISMRHRLGDISNYFHPY